MQKTEITRVSDVKNYIKNKYSKLNEKKFDIIKIGQRTYIYLVDREGNLQRSIIFQGNIPAINELPVLMRAFENGIHEAMKKWGYI
jgi:hypothetical protein